MPLHAHGVAPTCASASADMRAFQGKAQRLARLQRGGDPPMIFGEEHPSSLEEIERRDTLAGPLDPKMRSARAWLAGPFVRPSSGRNVDCDRSTWP
jgi:hypothetical protein